MTKAKSNKGTRVAVIVAIVTMLTVAVCIAVRGNEDTWIKDSGGKWVMHGHPEIHDFASCAKKNPVMTSYPEQCSIPGGPSFTNK